MVSVPALELACLETLVIVHMQLGEVPKLCEKWWLIYRTPGMITEKYPNGTFDAVRNWYFATVKQMAATF